MFLQTLHAALESSDPTGQLDRLVRNELAEGRTTAEIYAVLLPIVRTIRMASPLPQDVDEMLLGTLDALTGDCNPDECFQDPPATPSHPVNPEAPETTPLARGA
jgi:hypothetical protein